MSLQIHTTSAEIWSILLIMLLLLLSLRSWHSGCFCCSCPQQVVSLHRGLPSVRVYVSLAVLAEAKIYIVYCESGWCSLLPGKTSDIVKCESQLHRSPVVDPSSSCLPAQPWQEWFIARWQKKKIIVIILHHKSINIMFIHNFIFTTIYKTKGQKQDSLQPVNAHYRSCGMSCERKCHRSRAEQWPTIFLVELHSGLYLIWLISNKLNDLSRKIICLHLKQITADNLWSVSDHK